MATKSSNTKKGENFIKNSIKRPGALRSKAAHAGAIKPDGRIKVSWAKEQAEMKPKTDEEKLTKQQASFFVNVLRKAGKTQ